jgi:hypothetical protein
MTVKKYLVPVLLGLLAAAGYTIVDAQMTSQPVTPVTIAANQYPLTPISATAAVNNATTLTIPAPPAGMYNYVCSLHFNASQSGTGAAVNNGVTTSTNFNTFAIKFSILAVASQANYDLAEYWGIANVGCVKSTAPGTATTFVSPSASQTAFTWDATYYQAP